MAKTSAQNNVTMVDGTLNIDGCLNPDGTIYDNGGPTGDYTNSFNGYVVITANPGVTITLSGNYNTESCCDKITVYNGNGATGTILVNSVGGSGTLSATSTTGYMTIKFSTDYSVVKSGFALNYSCSIGGSCNNLPFDIRVDSVATNSVSLSWSAGNPSGPFRLTVNGTSTTVTDTSYTVTGLTEGTTYNLMLSSLADTGDFCCTNRRKIRTTCDAISRTDLPYLYGFEDATGSGTNYSINNCWTTYSAGGASACPTSDLPFLGTYALYMNNFANSTNIVALPEYLDQLDETMLEFWACSGPEALMSEVEIGVMTDPFDTSTFTPVGTITFNNTSYQYYYVSLDSYTGTGRYVAMRMKDRAQEVYIDNVALRLVPECPDVTGLMLEAVAATSMSVSWTLAGPSSSTMSGYEVTATPAGGGVPITMTTSNNPVILSGLTPETGYTVSVRVICLGGEHGNWDSLWAQTSSLCGGLSSPSGSETNQTNGVPVNSYWGNTICQTIYSAAQLHSMGMESGPIESITYTWTSNPNYDKEFSIYMGSTSQTHYTSSSPITGTMTLVYSGAHALNTSGTQTYDLSSNYIWDGTSNLVVTTLMNQPSGESHSTSGFYGISTQKSEYSSVYKYRDGTPYNISDLGLGSWNRSYSQPNVTFYSCVMQNGCMQPLLIVTEVGYSNVTLQWSIDSTNNSWDIAYKRVSDTAWTIVATNYPSNEYHINNLNRGTTYDFRVTAVCDSGTSTKIVTASTMCRNNTFNYDDLYASNVTCYTGSYSFPRQTVGVVNNGSNSQNSRHTVHNDRTETDPRTNNLLHTVPEGYCSSVRLGNWSTGAQAESITYTYQIDTNDYNLMLLKYASVLQDPNHTPIEQPRFTFNITDTNGNDVSLCYSADFIANPDLGWNSASNNVLWKDWTTVGIDLEPLQGQTLNITLTSYDCDQGGHYGYAYFVIDLDNKALSSTSCSSDENVFRAPSGFAYRWYSATNPSVTLATTDTLHVYQAGTYYCDLSFVGAPNDAAHSNCYYTMAAIAGERHPWARFTPTYIDTSTCAYTWMRMQNRSIITGDTAHTDSIGNGCENYLWRFDDGTSSTETNPRHAFTPGTHTVTLYAMLANGGCIDTATTTFFIATPCMFKDTVSLTLCAGDTLLMFDSVITAGGTYELDSIFNGDSLWLRTLYLTELENSEHTVEIAHCGNYHWAQSGDTYSESGLYNDTLTNAVGCDSVVTLSLTIGQNIDTTLYDTICEGQTLTFAGQSRGTAGVYVDSVYLGTGTLCDSITRLMLTVNDTSVTDTAASACNSYLWHGRSYTASTVDTLAGVFFNRAGCDSTVVLHLSVVRSTVGDTIVDTCDQFSWYGNSYTASTTDTLTGHYQNAGGCDSAVVLRLTIRESSSATYNDTCTENQLPRQYLSLTAYGDTMGAQLTTTNAAGCDSVITYNLHVLHNVGVLVDSTICDDALSTFVWHGLQPTVTALPDNYVGTKPTLTDTLQTTLQTAHGADSIVTLVLHVNPTYRIDIDDTICEGSTYTFNGQGYTATGTYGSNLSTTAMCDSLVTLHLTVNPNSVVDTMVDTCDQFLWYGNNYTSSTTDTLTGHYLNQGGCDSAVVLHLTLRQSSTATYNDTCLENHLPRQYIHLISHGDTSGAQMTIPNAAGCDSVITYNLHVWHNVSVTVDSTICDDALSTFEWHGLQSTVTALPDSYVGTKPTLTDTLQTTLQTTHGADSIVTLVLHVNPTYRFDIVDTICGGLTYTYNNHSYTATGIYIDTLSSTLMCDSIAHIDLFVKDTVLVDTMADECDSYTWYGETYTEEGQYLHFRPHQMANECDTAIILSLTLRHSTFGDTTATCCDHFSWYGQQYYSAEPTPTHTLTNSVNCDSTVSLHLTVNHSDTIELYDTIYPGETIDFEGETYSQPGNYVFHATNQHGCDSTRTLHLVWRHIVSESVSDSICEGNSYLFADTMLTEAGIYYDTLFSHSYPTPDTLRTLTLTVVPLPELRISSNHFCHNKPHYNLIAHSSVPFCRWSSIPDDPALEGHYNDTLVTVNPEDTTMYYVTADYREEPLCPVTDSIEVTLLKELTAHIETFPGNLTADRRTLTAYNRSSGQVDHQEWYVWYDADAPFYYGEESTITLEVPAYVDSLQLTLMVSNEFCEDADTLEVPILASSLFIPNVFTPTLETNNLFRAISTGVTEFEIWVYDRRGDLVFHATDINDAWDGTHEGAKCAQGAYVYKCRYKERSNPGGYQTKTGTVTLVR